MPHHIEIKTLLQSDWLHRTDESRSISRIGKLFLRLLLESFMSFMDLSKTKTSLHLFLFLQNRLYSLNFIMIYVKKHIETVTLKKSSRERSSKTRTTIKSRRTIQIPEFSSAILPSILSFLSPFIPRGFLVHCSSTKKAFPEL